MTQLLGKLPCERFPQDATFKTIGLGACPDCETMNCWLHYLRWEVERGITLNESYHHLVSISADARRRSVEPGVQLWDGDCQVCRGPCNGH